MEHASPTGQDALPVAAMVVHCGEVLKHRLNTPEPPSGVVVGCGNADEVVYLRRALCSMNVVGVDTAAHFSSMARAESCVVAGDARRLPFRSEAFDFSASFHSLEHVGDPRSALSEVRRVLRRGSFVYVGVPNRSRVVGYLGSFDATLWQKIAWNLIDWKARLRRRFQNELGAHAGFTKDELVELLGENFGNVQVLTEEFIRFKYANRIPGPLLNALLAPSVIDYVAPAHYAICQKLG